MTALEYLLDGLEAELELERELGVRVVELDRALLAPMAGSSRVGVESNRVALGSNRVALGSNRVALGSKPPLTDAKPPLTDAKSTLNNSNGPCSFAFLHDGPLSPSGIEMMAKIVTAMHETPESAPIVFTGERPPAKIYVVLGSKAMKKWYPGMHGSPGQWLRGREGEDVLVTYSPEHILRFGAVTPAVKKIKSDMWTSLKGVMQRIGYSK